MFSQIRRVSCTTLMHVFVILLLQRDNKPIIYGIYPNMKLAEKYLPPITYDILTRSIYEVPLSIFDDGEILEDFLKNVKYGFKDGIPLYLFMDIEPEIQIIEEGIFEME